MPEDTMARRRIGSCFTIGPLSFRALLGGMRISGQAALGTLGIQVHQTHTGNVVRRCNNVLERTWYCRTSLGSADPLRVGQACLTKASRCQSTEVRRREKQHAHSEGAVRSKYPFHAMPCSMCEPWPAHALIWRTAWSHMGTRGAPQHALCATVPALIFRYRFKVRISRPSFNGSLRICAPSLCMWWVCPCPHDCALAHATGAMLKCGVGCCTPCYAYRCSGGCAA